MRYLHDLLRGYFSTPPTVLYVFSNYVQVVFDPRLLLFGYAFQLGVNPRLLLYGFSMVYRRCLIPTCSLMAFWSFPGGVWSTPPTVLYFQWCTGGVWPRLLLDGFAIVYKSVQSTLSAAIWFCNGLPEVFHIHLLQYGFAIVKSTPSAKWFLQWFPFPRGVWTTSAVIWFCNG